MTTDKHVHEIDRIANHLQLWVNYQSVSKPIATLSGERDNICYAQGETELEAKDALLTKLRAIVCPDLKDYASDNETLEKAFDAASARNKDLQAKIQSLQSELESLKAEKPQQPTAREMLEALIEYYDNNKRWFLSSSRRSGVEYKGLTGIALLEFAEQWLKEKTKER